MIKNRQDNYDTKFCTTLLLAEDFPTLDWGAPLELDLTGPSFTLVFLMIASSDELTFLQVCRPLLLLISGFLFSFPVEDKCLWEESARLWGTCPSLLLSLSLTSYLTTLSHLMDRYATHLLCLHCDGVCCRLIKHLPIILQIITKLSDICICFLRNSGSFLFNIWWCWINCEDRTSRWLSIFPPTVNTQSFAARSSVLVEGAVHWNATTTRKTRLWNRTSVWWTGSPASKHYSPSGMCFLFKKSKWKNAVQTIFNIWYWCKGKLHFQES